MRRSFRIVVVLGLLAGGASLADAPDPHAQMAAALVTQADLTPRPVVLPVASAAPRHAASHSAVQRGIDPRAAAAAASARADAAREQAEAQAHAAAQAFAHAAQAAAAAAAGQSQAEAAKARAGAHPHPGK